MYFYYGKSKAIITAVQNMEGVMAKPKISKKEPDLQKLVREYWEALQEEQEKSLGIKDAGRTQAKAS
jgi:hypothetical protein